VLQQEIFGGAAEEYFLGVPEAQLSAIVQVIDQAKELDAGGPLCSGVFVAPSWVLTAGHCLQIDSMAVVVSGPGGESETLPVIGSAASDDADVALLNVGSASAADASSDGGAIAMSPIPSATSDGPTLVYGDPVEIAGYGLTQSGGVGSLHFVVESVVEIDSSTMTVSGFGASGACLGDSGGPLLVRASDGSVVVAGVLSEGSSTCLGDDVYWRVDALRDWIDQTVGATSPSDLQCGGITATGRCLYGDAMWCVNGEVVAQACAAPEACGWDNAQQGFRCVAPTSDPCRGVDSVGSCRSGEALMCDGGVLTVQDCGSCNGCGIDGMTGSPLCGPRVDVDL
jgi:hypothetical protein